MLVPSRSESFGLVALEAAACGIPVVASAVGGLLSLVDDGETGFLIAGRRPTDFATAIAAILDDAELAASMGAAAEARARLYTWRAAADRLRSLYVDLDTATELINCHVEDVTEVRPINDGASSERNQRGCEHDSPGARGRVVTDAFTGEKLAVLERQIDEWLAELYANHDHIVAVDRSPDDDVRWFVRMRGEDKDFTTVWLTLGQRTLRYETYVMPAPEENHAQLYEHVLRRNDRLVGARFSIGVENAIFLRGEVPVDRVDRNELDRVLGTLYAQVEQCFTGMIRIGFGSRFAG